LLYRTFGGYAKGFPRRGEQPMRPKQFHFSMETLTRESRSEVCVDTWTHGITCAGCHARLSPSHCRRIRQRRSLVEASISTQAPIASIFLVPRESMVTKPAYFVRQPA